MLWQHPDRGGSVRLAYCLNLHPSSDLEGTLEGLERITLPLRERLAPGQLFGVGLYLAASVAHELVLDGAKAERLFGFLNDNGLDPFTYNAFPQASFHAEGLKAGVFSPSWADPARLAFTLDVARIAARAPGSSAHVSISTHTGGYATDLADETAQVHAAENLARCARLLARLREESGRRIVLALEPEPDANCGNGAQLSAWLERVRAIAIDELGGKDDLVSHLGVCLDACHSAVEFETVEEALEAYSSAGVLGKLQITSALSLARPGSRPSEVESLLALDEPRFLHQVRGRGSRGLLRARDLGELAHALRDGKEPWLSAEEWRCHFHVPVDRDSLSAGGGLLSTTRAHADALMTALLERPNLWRSDELHLEIETYTWDLLPEGPRAPTALVEGLEREYAHVMALLERLGWRASASTAAPRPAR